MKPYWIKTSFWVKKIFQNLIWDIPNDQKKVYLTFDDGPTPEVTQWVLDTLKNQHAKATFFCIGKNIVAEPEIFKTIVLQGHAVGNHTFNHLKGWENDTETYLQNTHGCQFEILKYQNQNTKPNNLFRPPYGKIKPNQARKIRQLGYKIIMWDVLSADFDTTISAEECLHNVISNITSGSIIVFHDSAKAFENLKFVLPKTLQFLNKNGYVCSPIILG